MGRTKSVPSSWLENGTARKPCIIGERKTTRHGQNGADLVV
ncbi:hypothetical protein T11_3620 [Trichinella zimbabwensis]|uniref:Uncharacterized protein n=1 Tax=Trichinella zimbabwensis TaxID=268475 RepID=A0A0V1F6N5_9BILA|nr:hypothetical protein T11_3620 [Trichinella zimbabwensis]